MKQKTYLKIIDEKYIVPIQMGGGMIKFEAWESEGVVVKYNMVYINQKLYALDNGRVLGYDNAHNFHHKGMIIELDNFTTYQDQVLKFREDIKEFVHD